MAASAAITLAAPVMSAFIWCMPSAGLMEIPPESNVIPFPTTATTVIAHDDEARGLVAALRDGEIASHAQRATAVGVEDLALNARLLGRGLCFVREDRRCHLVRGLVRQAALQIHRIAHGLAPRDRLRGGLFGHDAHGLERRPKAPFGAAAVS